MIWPFRRRGYRAPAVSRDDLPRAPSGPAPGRGQLVVSTAMIPPPVDSPPPPPPPPYRPVGLYAGSASAEQIPPPAHIPSGSIAGCPVRMYEPGVTHEHRCLASSPHSGLEHTCECGTTWADLVVRTEGWPT